MLDFKEEKTKRLLLYHMLVAFRSRESVQELIDKHDLIDFGKDVDSVGICTWASHEKIIPHNSNFKDLLKRLNISKKTGSERLLWFKSFEDRRKEIVKAYSNIMLFDIKEKYDMFHLSNKDIMIMQATILQDLYNIYFSDTTLNFFLDQQNIDKKFNHHDRIGICIALDELYKSTFSITERKNITIDFLNLDKDDSHINKEGYWYENRQERFNVIKKELYLLREICIPNL